jgi:hypothetical protein
MHTSTVFVVVKNPSPTAPPLVASSSLAATSSHSVLHSLAKSCPLSLNFKHSHVTRGGFGKQLVGLKIEKCTKNYFEAKKLNK